MNQETYWKIRLSKFVVPYYYLKCILFIIFNCFKIAKSYDDCLNILGQCDPDKNNHGLMHLKVKSRTKIIETAKDVLPKFKWRNFKTGNIDVRVDEPFAKEFIVWSDEIAAKTIWKYSATEASDYFFELNPTQQKVYCVENVAGATLIIFKASLKDI